MLDYLLTESLHGRGRRRPVISTAANVARVEELICSQEDAPSTHNPREIERKLASHSHQYNELPSWI